MKFLATIGEATHEVEIRGSGSSLEIFVDGRAVEAELSRIGTSSLFSLVIGGQSHELLIEPNDEGYAVTTERRSYTVKVEDERARLLRLLVKDRSAAVGQVRIRAPMPGLIVRVQVSEGDRVEAGKGLLVVEAMKMENEIRSPVSGRVKKVAVRERQAVDKDEELLILEADGSG